MSIKIVQPDKKVIGGPAVSNGVKFFNDDGSEIKDVIKCEVTFEVDCIATAKIWMYTGCQTILAEPILSLDSLEKSADHYGMKLVKK